MDSTLRALSVSTRFLTVRSELKPFFDIIGNMALLAIAALILCAVAYSPLHLAPGWRTAGLFLGVTLLVAATAVFVGGAVGFLFGIPKVASIGSQRVSSNTNLEQVSDWLTKIIVGVSLIEFGQINRYLISFDEFITRSFNVPGLGAACDVVMVLSAVSGFLSFYLITRTSIVFDQIEKERIDLSSGAVAEVVSAAQKRLSGRRVDLAPSTVKAAQDIVRNTSPITDDPETLVKLASANLIIGQPETAARMFKLAESASPDSTDRRNAARAFALARKPEQAEGLLKKQKGESKGRAGDAKSWADTLSRMFVALYKKPPHGFAEALRIGEPLVGQDKARSDAEFHYYLTAAYGQQHAYEAAKGAPSAQLSDIRDLALKNMKATLQLDPEYARSFEVLLDPESDDNDLASFGEDPDFLRLLD